MKAKSHHPRLVPDPDPLLDVEDARLEDQQHAMLLDISVQIDSAHHHRQHAHDPY